MKRCLSLLLALALVFSLTACGGAGNVNSNKITIAGKAYQLPMKGSELLNNGWSVPDAYTNFDNNFKAETKSITTGLQLTDSQSNRLGITCVYNESSEVKGLEDCWIFTIEVERESVGDESLLSLPGGVSLKSTYDDVVAAYGEPGENNQQFESSSTRSGNGNKSLNYTKQNKSYLSYDFSFPEKENSPANRISIDCNLAYWAMKDAKQ